MELKASNISFSYNKNRKILQDFSLSVNSDQIIGLMGDSGSGKSTLCKIMAGYISHYFGEVTLDGKQIPDKDFYPVQLIFQHPEKTMNPKWKMDQVLKESWDVTDDFLEEFGIQKTWLTRFPQELSGGELQRFSVLRSLNPNTKFLIADEMTTMLDAITQVQILDAVLKIVKQRKMGFLLVSHDMDLVNTICDDIIYFDDINGI